MSVESIRDVYEENIEDWRRDIRSKPMENDGINKTEGERVEFKSEELINIPMKKVADDLVPFYGSEGASGADARANVDIDEQVCIYPNSSAMIPTGLYMAVPLGYEIQVRPRSGLAAKHMITVLNTPGTIDSDYRGEIKIILMNHSNTKNFFIERGDRIAQLVLVKLPPHMSFNQKTDEEWDTLNTNRGVGGFGSTGVQ